MGNCGCLSKANREERTEFTFQKPTFVEEIGQSQQHLIKLQAVIRGYLARKRLYEIRMQDYNHRVTDNLKQLASTYFSTKFDHLHPFAYDCEEDLRDPLFEQRVFKPVQRSDIGETYIGEW